MKTNELIMTYSPWIKFDTIDWSPYENCMILKTYDAKEIIYHQGEKTNFVYLVKSGRVRLSTFSKAGREQALSIAEGGCLFGEMSIVDNENNFTTSTTIVKSQVYLIPKDRFKDIYFNNKDINNLMFKSIVRKVRILSSLVESLSFHSAERRVASYLIELLSTHNDHRLDPPTLNIKFTQQELADLTGLSRVSVSQVMNTLFELNVISKKNGYIVFKDLEYLKNIS